MELLDLSTIKTVEDINNIDLSKYTDSQHKNWIRHIKYPVAQSEFDRLNALSSHTDCNIELYDSMGDLYYTKYKFKVDH